MTISAGALIAMLLGTGVFELPQAQAVVAYAQRESGLDPCAKSWMGEGLFGLSGKLRREQHDEAGMSGCVPVEHQIEFMVAKWSERACRVRFDAGDLSAFQRCWGRGRQR